MTTNVYVILTSIIFPVLAICWLCCIAICIYRSVIKMSTRTQRSRAGSKVKVSQGVQICLAQSYMKLSKINVTFINCLELAVKNPV